MDIPIDIPAVYGAIKTSDQDLAWLDVPPVCLCILINTHENHVINFLQHRLQICVNTTLFKFPLNGQF